MVDACSFPPDPARAQRELASGIGLFLVGGLLGLVFEENTLALLIGGLIPVIAGLTLMAVADIRQHGAIPRTGVSWRGLEEPFYALARLICRVVRWLFNT